MVNKIIFNNGVDQSTILDNPEKLIEELLVHHDYIRKIEIDDLIEFFDALSSFWKNNKELEKKIGGSLKHLAEFIEKDKLVRMLDFSLRGDYHCLDKFIDFNQPNYFYTCHPRGLVVHWIAGNVPLLGLYSVIQAMLTKNVSLVKASSHAYKELLVLLNSFKDVHTDRLNGEDIIKVVSVILIDREDHQTQNKISKQADVRVAWGGREAIKAISSLERNIFSEDIIFGPKYSYGIVGKEMLKDFQKITQRIAFDVSAFDQYACSSPHTIFVEIGGDISPKKFAQELSKNMALVNEKIMPKNDFDSSKNMDILLVRAKYSMNGEIFSSKNCDWTVIYTEEEGLANPCFSRVVFVKPIDNLIHVGKFNTRKIQTIGCSLGDERRLDLLREVTKKGADRCPEYGAMTLYESPWDGFFPLDKMIRWVKCYKNDKKEK